MKQYAQLFASLVVDGIPRSTSNVTDKKNRIVNTTVIDPKSKIPTHLKEPVKRHIEKMWVEFFDTLSEIEANDAEANTIYQHQLQEAQKSLERLNDLL